ncbi:unnamed protein product [Allacma fusca]|uniref:Uncharacterized protein n=1 Tax=Allacma fusca TaxID=39272 RepID=A0A8J2KRW9_9HEXA|nr:unnamed protein product [Allacma fusca]
MFSKSSDDQGEEQPDEFCQQLVDRDPVLACLLFQRQIQALLNVINSRQRPFGPITCHYSPTEFTERRGLVHVYVVLWIDGAPKDDPDMGDVELEAYLSFLDDHASTEWKQDQVHNCGSECTASMPEDTRGGDPDRVCSKGFPMFPMEQSVILKPFVDCEIASANT